MLSAVINTSSSGNNTIVAAPGPGKVIAVFGYTLVPANDVAITWKSGGTSLSGAMGLLGNIPLVSGYSDVRQFTCGENQSLILNTSGSVGVTGHLSYTVEDV